MAFIQLSDLARATRKPRRRGRGRASGQGLGALDPLGQLSAAQYAYKAAQDKIKTLQADLLTYQADLTKVQSQLPQLQANAALPVAPPVAPGGAFGPGLGISSQQSYQYKQALSAAQTQIQTDQNQITSITSQINQITATLPLLQQNIATAQKAFNDWQNANTQADPTGINSIMTCATNWVTNNSSVWMQNAKQTGIQITADSLVDQITKMCGGGKPLPSTVDSAIRSKIAGILPGINQAAATAQPVLDAQRQAAYQSAMTSTAPAAPTTPAAPAPPSVAYTISGGLESTYVIYPDGASALKAGHGRLFKASSGQTAITGPYGPINIADTSTVYSAFKGAGYLYLQNNTLYVGGPAGPIQVTSPKIASCPSGQKNDPSDQTKCIPIAATCPSGQINDPQNPQNCITDPSVVQVAVDSLKQRAANGEIQVFAAPTDGTTCPPYMTSQTLPDGSSVCINQIKARSDAIIAKAQSMFGQAASVITTGSCPGGVAASTLPDGRYLCVTGQNVTVVLVDSSQQATCPAGTTLTTVSPAGDLICVAPLPTQIPPTQESAYKTQAPETATQYTAPATIQPTLVVGQPCILADGSQGIYTPYGCVTIAEAGAMGIQPAQVGQPCVLPGGATGTFTTSGCQLPTTTAVVPAPYSAPAYGGGGGGSGGGGGNFDFGTDAGAMPADGSEGTPPPPPPPPQNTWVKPVAIALAVAAAVGGIAWYYSKKDKEETEEPKQEETSE